jgi:hypothetical protein
MYHLNPEVDDDNNDDDDDPYFEFPHSPTPRRLFSDMRHERVYFKIQFL